MVVSFKEKRCIEKSMCMLKYKYRRNSFSYKRKEELIREYFWINNERLVYTMDKGGKENAKFSPLI
jgi:hypothetical protein